MTYCVALKLDQSLIFMSDTRTNAGIDNVSRYKKMFTWSIPGDRVITLMTAGNLATTQAVVSLLDERSKAPDDRDPTLLRVPTLFQAAKLIGDTLKEVVGSHRDGGQEAEATFGATLIMGGQIKGMEPRLFMIYPEGNFVEASWDTPFFQIGETKYGRPIIIRGYDRDMNFEDAIKLLMVSFDSTLKANLSVGLPLDLLVIGKDEFAPTHQHRLTHDDPYFDKISSNWGDALRSAFHSLPDYKIDS